MDKGTLGGLLLAALGIIGGMLLEGGNLGQITQPVAGMIVLGGTIGAVMIQFPLKVFLTAMGRLVHIFVEKKQDARGMVNEIVGYANRARKDGIVSLDSELAKIKDPFLKKSLMLAVDGTEPQELRKMMELELDNHLAHEENIPKVFEAAGGFAPTVGIIGAVLGLIQVMQNLDNIDEVGKGIAVAFVATIYGIGLANIFFLPAAGKLKLRIHDEMKLKEMTLEGVISILEGMNPRMIETKLMGFIGEEQQEPQREKAA